MNCRSGKLSGKTVMDKFFRSHALHITYDEGFFRVMEEGKKAKWMATETKKGHQTIRYSCVSLELNEDCL